MSTVSFVIRASALLRQRQAGLSGVARCVILADLAGADRIVIVGNDPPRDWALSFATRERPLPQVELAAAAPSPRAGERLVAVPGDVLVTPAGMALLRDDPDARLVPGLHHYEGSGAAALTRAILASTVKPTDGWVCRHINRPISSRISAVLLRFGVGPMPVTWFTLALAAVMAAVLVQGGWAALALGGALYQAVSVIDGVDGEIARASYRFSARGALLDTACDMIANFGFALGLMTGLIRSEGPEHGVYAMAIAALLLTGITLMLVLLRMGPRRGSFDVLRAALALRLAGAPRLRDVVLAAERLFKRDVYVLVGCIACLAGLAPLLPPLIVSGLAIWLLAIAWCAPLIAADRAGALLPPHLRAN